MTKHLGDLWKTVASLLDAFTGCDFVFLPWSDCSGQETDEVLLGRSILSWLGKLCDFILLVSARDARHGDCLDLAQANTKIKHTKK